MLLPFLSLVPYAFDFVACFDDDEEQEQEQQQEQEEEAEEDADTESAGDGHADCDNDEHQDTVGRLWVGMMMSRMMSMMVAMPWA